MRFNRAERRANKSRAKELAGKFATKSYDYDTSGILIRVENPKAIAVLRRAFTHLLERGGDPYAMQITRAEAAAFPRPSAPEGVQHSLAVGIDVTSRATYSLAWAYTDVDGSSTDATLLAEAKALDNLAESMRVAGFPVPKTTGRA
ncbi:hypothetical protein RGQ15_10170 [Paracoccus sp. MBLB3053]|uniref:Uncharacterized protein n=1 Tax=Paracoccus aurantius TaxID=3073814 RepID=A0ABU2HTT2_9RHOB|nr:hypothetical protein [Paracoccus sp. MBLB3053]MDS9467930.1 hypothetical protein [Paracoccus sp. MBLB3053]